MYGERVWTSIIIFYVKYLKSQYLAKFLPVKILCYTVVLFYLSVWAVRKACWVLKKILPGDIKSNTQWFWCKTIDIHERYFWSNIWITINEHSSYSICIQVETIWYMEWQCRKCMVDWVVMVDCMVIDWVVCSGRNDYFRQFLIHNGYPDRLVHQCWYDQFHYAICLLNQLNGEKSALFLPEARCAFLIVAALQFFAYQLHNSQKSYQGKNMSFLCTAECHLERNTLLL